MQHAEGYPVAANLSSQAGRSQYRKLAAPQKPLWGIFLAPYGFEQGMQAVVIAVHVDEGGLLSAQRRFLARLYVRSKR